MPKRMLIDASHPEETRVVILDGQKVEEFDFEAATKRPLKGNIYLAKVTRVEPSLQAAFVEYGGNRQGFLAFSEIHPDYYQIPMADRMALLAEQEAEVRRRAAEDSEIVETAPPGSTSHSEEAEDAQSEEGQTAESSASEASAEEENEAEDEFHGEDEERDEEEDEASAAEIAEESEAIVINPDLAPEPAFEASEDIHDDGAESDQPEDSFASESDTSEDTESSGFNSATEFGEPHDHQAAFGQPAETSGEELTATEQSAEGTGEAPQQRQNRLLQRPNQRWTRRRHYKIQEVIKRRQIILVQVVKEERGNKGAALTTFLSLPGRYCVLMPNTPRGGGISRKITNPNDRKRLKSAAQSLELPEGMGLIIRTAGESRTKTEIKRDYEYLLRLWDSIRELTLKSNAPACVYEEGDLIKRTIRDLYSKDISEVVVEGDEGYRNAKEFMRMIMPSHAKNVKPFKDVVPLFQRHHIEAQLDAMFSPIVHLKSGGYIVINQTEALVSIDVNSGRATREHSIEETAHKTNLEAADEIARQLRLRDLAGLIVIDFIDMEDGRNDRDVEKRLYNAVKNDRARIQLGKISQFGLLEMSRQRLRAGVIAGSTVPCPHCGGQGIVRSVESTTLRVLRALEEEGQRQRASSLVAYVQSDVAVYALNQKRREIARIEAAYDLIIQLEPKESILAGTFEIVRTGTRTPEEIAARQTAVSLEAGFAASQPDAAESEAEIEEPVQEEEIEEAAEEQTGREQNQQYQTDGQQREGSRRRRRRRRGGRGRDRDNRDSRPPGNGSEQQNGAPPPVELAAPPGGESMPVPQSNLTNGEQRPGESQNGNGEGGVRRRRRRRRRGRGRHDGENFGQQQQPQPENLGNAPARFEPVQGHDEIDTTPQPVEPRQQSRQSRPDFSVAPNSTSTPVWSLSAEKSERDRSETKNERAETPTQKATSDETASPARKGWWQRTFKS